MDPASSSSPAAICVSTRYRLKNDLAYLKRPNADIDVLVADNDRASGVAERTTYSPNFERQTRALVKSVRSVHQTCAQQDDPEVTYV